MWFKNNNILIISNAAMNDTDANGRTISRLLDCIPKENKSQFFTYGEPSFLDCSDFYKVTDNDILHNLFSPKRINGEVVALNSYKNSPDDVYKPPLKKNPFILLCRELCWRVVKWKNIFLRNWIDKINPKYIFLYLGDNWFTIDFAIWVAKKRNIPIIVYSTEEYQFKHYNYITKRKSLFYSLWNCLLNKHYNKLSRYTKLGLFNSIELTNLYSGKYNYPCKVLYQKSNIDFVDNHYVKDKKVISYLGNLGLNRHKALIDIAKTLFEIDPTLTLDIYSNPKDEVKRELELQPNIILKGFIPYSDVKEIIHKSSLLIHVEYKDKFYDRDLKYSFSTKITDSVCSGTPLFVYAPTHYAGIKFLEKERCAFIASDSTKLCEELFVALNDEEKRKIVVEAAYKVKQKYFNENGCFFEYVKETVGI